MHRYSHGAAAGRIRYLVTAVRPNAGVHYGNCSQHLIEQSHRPLLSVSSFLMTLCLWLHPAGV